jgi:hypothetical protein
MYTLIRNMKRHKYKTVMMIRNRIKVKKGTEKKYWQKFKKERTLHSKKLLNNQYKS